jgi:glycyl-tRNA synthetase
MTADDGRSPGADAPGHATHHARPQPAVGREPGVNPMAPKSTLDNVISLAKRRGFVFQAGEIYGGSRSAWDYGPLGAELKENIKHEWWQTFVRGREDMVGLDSSIILPKPVWEASGHVATFTDPLVECTSCHKRARQDHLVEAFEEKKGRAPENGMAEIPCPNCGTKGQWTEPQQFSGLLKTFLGPVDNEEGLHYLRPETAQGIFVNFNNVVTAARKKPPFGIGQIGKAFRNEITPGNFIFRTREFEQMEIEYFTHPDEAGRWFDEWVEACWNWFTDLGIDPDHMRRYDVPEDDRAHYSAGTIDIEYRFGFQGNPWGELMGVANRTDYDLGVHNAHSNADLNYFDQQTNERYLPYVIEPSFGLTRSMMAFLVDAYTEDEAPNSKGGVDKRTVLKLDPRLAPVKAAVLPLSRNEDLSPKARDLAAELRRNWNIDFDDSGAIGRRYRRQDEIGTPYCITVDFDTLEDQAVTIRERDAMTQERVALDQVKSYLAGKLVR